MFVLYKDWGASSLNDPQAVVEAHKKYSAYLEKNKNRFPPEAYEFASADWHHNYDDHRALHDSWVESLNIEEVSDSDQRGVRNIQIKLRLLGAYWDGYIELLYKSVRSYSIVGKDVSSGHGDLHRDEVRLSESGLVIHEIEWHGVAQNWLIECENIIFSWVPLEDTKSF